MPTLYYFDLYGRGEPMRMLLSHAQVQFDDKRITQEEFITMREDGTLPSGQVPLWEDEGRQLNQTSAILRLLGKQHGYYSMDPMEGYNADWAVETGADLFGPAFVGLYFKPGDQVTQEDIDPAVEKFGKWVKTLETRLASLDGVYFGANSINIGDFMLFGIFNSTVRNKSANSAPLREALEATLAEVPNVRKWLDAMSSELKDYLEQRPPRPL